MPKRGSEEIRKDIAAERERLDRELTELQTELRSFTPFVIGGLAVVALVSFRKGALRPLRTVGRLV